MAESKEIKEMLRTLQMAGIVSINGIVHIYSKEGYLFSLAANKCNVVPVYSKMLHSQFGIINETHVRNDIAFDERDMFFVSKPPKLATRL